MQKSYEIVLNTVKNIINDDNNIDYNIETIWSDFEEGIINAIYKIFNEIRHAGCLFHFIKNVRLNLVKIELYHCDITYITDLLLKKKGSLPFKIHDNNIIINDIFKEFDKKYNN